ncbi:MAG: UDP-N-acetylglucosamine 2-epimerase [Candidatus Omnitrophota bacterium]
MKKLCIVTGTRAEWGLFSSLAKEIKKDENDLILQIIAAGTHLSGEHGFTGNEIIDDGFEIDREVKTFIPDDTEESTGESVNLGIKGFMNGLRGLKPDLVLLLGDRFETFAAAQAAFFLKIPIAHIHGGELTEGAIDDAFRHAITKMANLHFTSTETYRKRVIQMGEAPERVFNTGALGIDSIKNTSLLDRKALEEELKFELGNMNFLVTFHPVTLEEREASGRQIKNLLEVIDRHKNAKVIFTGSNCDMYSKTVKELIDLYVSENGSRAKYFVSLGQKRYFSAMRFADLVAGNSSSGIIEASSFGIPTVNIGDRQKGRIRPGSVVDADGSFESIDAAFKKALSDDFRTSCRKVKNPYGDGRAAEKIVKAIKAAKDITIKKKFHDVDFSIREKRGSDER